MVVGSPTDDPYDDDFDSPTPSESNDPVRPPSLRLTPTPEPTRSAKHSRDDDLDDKDRNNRNRHIDSPIDGYGNNSPRDIVSVNSRNGYSRKDTSSTLPRELSGKARDPESRFPQSRADSRSPQSPADSYHRDRTRVESAKRNESRLSRLTYTADEDRYEDDFDDNEFPSDFEADDEPIGKLPPPKPSNAMADDVRESRVSRKSSYDDQKDIVSHKNPSNDSMSSRMKLQNGSRLSISTKKSAYNTMGLRLGSRNHTNLSVMKTVKKGNSQRKDKSRMSRNSRYPSPRQLDPDEMRREIRIIADEIEGLKIENKSLKRNNILLTHQLGKREKEESEIPNLYDRHTKELKVLKDHLKRQQGRYDKTHERLRKVEGDLREASKYERDLEKQADEEGLKERSRLRKRLEIIDQQNALCDEKIQQLERYAENLEKCHEAEMAAEIEKHRETQAVLEEVSEQARVAKESIHAKESELDKFRIRHTSRLSMSRALAHTSLSGSMSVISETPTAGVMSSNTDPAANHNRDYNKRAQQQLKALPAPPAQSNASNEENSVMHTPSPPTTSRNAQKNSRYNRVTANHKPTNGSNRERSKPPTSDSRFVTQQQLKEEEMRRSRDEERRAEAPGSSVARQDSWEAITTAQEKINTGTAAGKPGSKDKFGSVMSLSLSIREQTFAIMKPARNDSDEKNDASKAAADSEETARRREEGEGLRKGALTKETRGADRSSRANIFSESTVKSGEEHTSAFVLEGTKNRHSPRGDPLKKDLDTNVSLQFGDYKPSYSSSNANQSRDGSLSQLTNEKASSFRADKSPWESDTGFTPERKAPQRPRETTITKHKTTASSLFGNDLDDLDL